MRKLRPKSNTAARKMACTVSAAALMLGVSQAATVGFNFQVDYCGSTAAYRNNVTATAFGIPVSGWENLTAMMTGYGGAPCNQLSYTLNEVIDTTTSSGGLNPLPSGSVTVDWTAPTANFSNWGGYDRGGPYYDFGGSAVVPGEGEVYAGFFRDGINFGPPGGADNSVHLPPYSVDITGLKTVFTNTPFVIELIASSDSMYHLTNAFIIDVVASSTQSVVYPNPSHPRDQGDAPWIRGHGGGLSTVSTALNTDHVKLVGNFPQHSISLDTDKTHSINNASCISGFIVTDKPVVTMYPQPVKSGPHDDVLLRVIAAGVPPLSYQWRKGGAPIAGATAANYAISNINASANYDVVVTNLYGSATSKVSAVTVDNLRISPQPFVLDSKPSGTPINGAALGAKWIASSTDVLGTNRTGVMHFDSSHPDEIILPGDPSLDSATGTIMFWIRSTNTGGAGNDGAMILDRRTTSGAVILLLDDGTIEFDAADGANTAGSGAAVLDDQWHHVAMTYDQTASGFVNVYMDGTLVNGSGNSAAWAWPAGQQLEIGHSHDSHWRSLDGYLDDIRIYNRVLTAPEVASAHTTGALVDTAALKLRLNFDARPVAGVGLSWNATDATLQSANAVTGPFTDVSPAVTSSPYYVLAQPSPRFFRYRRTAVTLTSNPYDM